MKKLKFLTLAGIFALSLAACGNPATEEQTAAEPNQTTVSETEPAAENTETEPTLTETTEEVTEAEPVKECHCPTEWQHAYSEYMNGLEELDGGVYLGDINGDDIPEAVLSPLASYTKTTILYHNENGMGELHLDPNPNWCFVRYLPEPKQILFSPFYGHTMTWWGYEEYYIYDWNGSDYEVTSSILREAGYYGLMDDEVICWLGQAYIDGEPVDNDTFEIRLAEIEKLRDENGYFPMVKTDDENFIGYVKENFPCFDHWDMVFYMDYNHAIYLVDEDESLKN